MFLFIQVLVNNIYLYMAASSVWYISGTLYIVSFGRSTARCVGIIDRALSIA